MATIICNVVVQSFIHYLHVSGGMSCCLRSKPEGTLLEKLYSRRQMAMNQASRGISYCPAQLIASSKFQVFCVGYGQCVSYIETGSMALYCSYPTSVVVVANEAPFLGSDARSDAKKFRTCLTFLQNSLQRSGDIFSSKRLYRYSFSQ